MFKTIILIIFTISTIGCQTAIIPTVIVPKAELRLMPYLIIKQGNKRTLVVYSPLTYEERSELKKKFNKHNNQDIADDIDMMWNYKYHCKSDWVCTEEPGSWNCYCNVME